MSPIRGQASLHARTGEGKEGEGEGEGREGEEEGEGREGEGGGGILNYCNV